MGSVSWLNCLLPAFFGLTRVWIDGSGAEDWPGMGVTGLGTSFADSWHGLSRRRGNRN